MYKYIKLVYMATVLKRTAQAQLQCLVIMDSGD